MQGGSACGRETTEILYLDVVMSFVPETAPLRRPGRDISHCPFSLVPRHLGQHLYNRCMYSVNSDSGVKQFCDDLALDVGQLEMRSSLYLETRSKESHLGHFRAVFLHTPLGLMYIVYVPDLGLHSANRSLFDA